VELIAKSGDFGVFLSGILALPELTFSKLNLRDLGGVRSGNCFNLLLLNVFSLSLSDVFSNSLVVNAFFRVSTWKKDSY
jgi:hypothetical protein